MYEKILILCNRKFIFLLQIFFYIIQQGQKSPIAIEI